MKPKTKVSEAEVDISTLDLRLFEKMSILDEEGNHHVTNIEMGVMRYEDTDILF
jgi:hypothetical protein